MSWPNDPLSWTDKPAYEPAPPVAMNPWYTAEMVGSDGPWRVYLVETKTHYKIGITRNIKQRLEVFNQVSASKVSLVAVRVGGRDLEKQLHDALAEHRTSGEWFLRCDAVRKTFFEMAPIEAINEPEPEKALPLFGDAA